MKKDVLTLQTKQHNPPSNSTVPVSMDTTLHSAIPHDGQPEVRTRTKARATSNLNALSKPYTLLSSKASPSAACVSSKSRKQIYASKLHSAHDSGKKNIYLLAPYNLLCTKDI